MSLPFLVYFQGIQNLNGVYEVEYCGKMQCVTPLFSTLLSSKEYDTKH